MTSVATASTTTTTIYDMCLQNSNDGEKELVPALLIPSPKTINFADVPLAQNPTIKKIVREAFEKKVANRRGISSYTWTETYFIPQCVKKRYEMGMKSQHIEATSDDNPLGKFYARKPRQLVLCDMKEYGFSVYANESIAKGDVVAIYTGELQPHPKPHERWADNVYSISCTSPSFLFSSCSITGENVCFGKDALSNCVINATRVGNYASFVMHLPTTLPQELLSRGVAISNLITAAGVYQNYPFYCFLAKRNINKNELLGFDYGAKYWTSKKVTPSLFTTDGQPISLSSVANNFIEPAVQTKRVDQKSKAGFGYLTRADIISCLQVNKAWHACLIKLYPELHVPQLS